MSSALALFQPLRGDIDALARSFAADPGSWLPDARRDGDGWRLTVHAGALSRTVVATVGAPWGRGASHWRSLSWDPVHDDGDRERFSRILPSLDGELVLHLANGRATLAFEARYQPPGGPLGAAADAVALHRVARATGERFLADVARGLADAAAPHAVGVDAAS